MVPWLLNANFFASYQILIVACLLATEFPASLNGEDTLIEISELEEPDKTSAVSNGLIQRETFLRSARAINPRAKPKTKQPPPANAVAPKENENSVSDYYEGTLAITVAPCQKEGIVLMQGKANYYIKCSWNEETKDFYQVVYICRQNMRSMADAGKCIPPPDCSKCKSNSEISNPVPAPCPPAPACPKLPKQKPLVCPAPNPLNEGRNTLGTKGGPTIGNGLDSRQPGIGVQPDYRGPFSPNNPLNSWPNKSMGRTPGPSFSPIPNGGAFAGAGPDAVRIPGGRGPNDAGKPPSGISGVPFGQPKGTFGNQLGPDNPKSGKPGGPPPYSGGRSSPKVPEIQSPLYPNELRSMPPWDPTRTNPNPAGSGRNQLSGGKQNERFHNGGDAKTNGQGGGSIVDGRGSNGENGMASGSRNKNLRNEGERTRSGVNQIPGMLSPYGQVGPANRQDPHFRIDERPGMAVPGFPKANTPQYVNVPPGLRPPGPQGPQPGRPVFPGRNLVSPDKNLAPNVQQPGFGSASANGGINGGGNRFQNGNAAGSRGMQQQEMEGRFAGNTNSKQNQFGENSQGGYQLSGGRVSGKTFTKVDKVTTKKQEFEEKVHVDRKEEVQTIVRKIITKKGKKNKNGTRTVTTSVVENNENMGSNNMATSLNQNAGGMFSGKMDTANFAAGQTSNSQGSMAGRGQDGMVKAQAQRPVGAGPNLLGPAGGQRPLGPGVGRPQGPNLGRASVGPGAGRPQGPNIGQMPLRPGKALAPPGPVQRLQGPGQRPLGPGQRPLGPGQRPLGPGQQPVGPGQRPLGQGQRPVGPGQRPLGRGPVGAVQKPQGPLQRRPVPPQMQRPSGPLPGQAPGRQGPFQGFPKTRPPFGQPPLDQRPRGPGNQQGQKPQGPALRSFNPGQVNPQLQGPGNRPGQGPRRGGRPTASGRSFPPQGLQAPPGKLGGRAPPGMIPPGPPGGNPNAPIMRKPNVPLANTQPGPSKLIGTPNMPTKMGPPGKLNRPGIPQANQQVNNRGSGGNGGNLQGRKANLMENKGAGNANNLKNIGGGQNGRKIMDGNQGRGKQPGTEGFALDPGQNPGMIKGQKLPKGPPRPPSPGLASNGMPNNRPQSVGAPVPPQGPRMPGGPAGLGGRTPSGPSMPGNPRSGPGGGLPPIGMPVSPGGLSLGKAGSSGQRGSGNENGNRMMGSVMNGASQTGANNQRFASSKTSGNQTSEDEEDEEETLETEMVMTRKIVIFTTRREFFSSLSYESSFTMVVENSFFWDSIYSEYGKIARVQASEVFADGAQSAAQGTSVAIAKQQCAAPGLFPTEDSSVFADCSGFPRNRQPFVKKCGNNYIFASAVGHCLHLSLPGILKNDLGYHMGRSPSDPIQARALPLAIPQTEFPGMSFNCPAFGFVPFGTDDRFFMDCKGVGGSGMLQSCPFGYFFCPRRLQCILGQDIMNRPEFKQSRVKGFSSSGGSPLWGISQCVNEGIHSYPDYRFYYVCELSPNSVSFLPPKLYQCPPGLFYNQVYRLCTKTSAFQIFNYDFEWRNVYTERSISQKMDLRSGISVHVGSIPFSVLMSDKPGKFATVDPRYYYISAPTPGGPLGVRLFVCHSGFFFSSKLGHCVPAYLQENVIAGNSYKYGVNIAEKANIVLEGRELLGSFKPAAILLATPNVGPMQVLTNWRMVFGMQIDRSGFYMTLAPCTASGVFATPDYRYFYTCVEKGGSAQEEDDNEEEAEEEAKADAANENEEAEEEEEYEQILYQCAAGLYFSASTGFCVGSYYHSNIAYGRWEKYAWGGTQLKLTGSMTSEGMGVSEENIPWIVPGCGKDGMLRMRDPRYYVRCRGGQRALFICPTNTYFNPKTQSCKPLSGCDCWEDVGLAADPAPKSSNLLPGMDLEVQIILDRSYLQVVRKVLETMVSRAAKVSGAYGKDSALISRLICFWRDMETQRTLRFPNKLPTSNSTGGQTFPNGMDYGVREVRSLW